MNKDILDCLEGLDNFLDRFEKNIVGEILEQIKHMRTSINEGICAMNSDKEKHE